MKSSEADGLKTVGAIVLVIALVIVGIVSYSNRPTSTAGVQLVDNDTAIIKNGDTLVLRKSKKTWRVTYDGETTVTTSRSGLSDRTYTTTLCGVDCQTTLTINWRTSLTFTELADHRVQVDWGSGWRYQEHRP